MESPQSMSCWASGLPSHLSVALTAHGSVPWSANKKEEREREKEKKELNSKITVPVSIFNFLLFLLSVSPISEKLVSACHGATYSWFLNDTTLQLDNKALLTTRGIERSCTDGRYITTGLQKPKTWIWGRGEARTHKTASEGLRVKHTIRKRPGCEGFPTDMNDLRCKHGWKRWLKTTTFLRCAHEKEWRGETVAGCVPRR